jgi:hypothetical protein
MHVPTWSAGTLIYDSKRTTCAYTATYMLRGTVSSHCSPSVPAAGHHSQPKGRALTWRGGSYSTLIRSNHPRLANGVVAIRASVPDIVQVLHTQRRAQEYTRAAPTTKAQRSQHANPGVELHLGHHVLVAHHAVSSHRHSACDSVGLLKVTLLLLLLIGWRCGGHRVACGLFVALKGDGHGDIRVRIAALLVRQHYWRNELGMLQQ